MGLSLGSVIGGVGGFFVGGPAGAAAGYQLGGALEKDLKGSKGPAGINPAVAGSSVSQGVRGRLIDRAMGIEREGSPEELKLQAQLQQNAASANSLAASARGVNAGLANRMAQQSLAQTNMQTIQQNQLANQAAAQQNLQQYLAQAENDRAARMGLAGTNLQAQQMNKQQDNQMLGGILNTAGTLGAAYMGMPAKPAAT